MNPLHDQLVARRSRRRGSLMWLAPGLVTFAVLRIPSFLEPHWYTWRLVRDAVDVLLEAVPGDIDLDKVSAAIRSQPRIVEVHDLHLWTITGVVGLFGPREAALHGLTFISGALTVGAVYWAALRLFGARRAAVAACAAGLVLGLPILDAELALPESLLIAPVSWAGAILLVQLHRARPSSRAPMRWPIVVGLLLAIGVAYQQTVVAESCAFGLAIALSTHTRVRDLAAYLAALIIPTAAWVGVTVAQAGGAKVAFALVGFYIPFTTSVFPGSKSGVALHLAASLAALTLLVLGAYLCRRQAKPTWALMLWLGAALLVPAFARQPYAHYLTQTAAPAALALAALPLPRRERIRSLQLRWLPQVAGVCIAAVMATVAGLDWIPPAAGSRTLGLYYGGAVAGVLDSERWLDWDNGFDYRVRADEAVAAWLRHNQLTGRSTVVWSSDTWLYALADLPVSMPTPPIYNDEVLLGQHGPVAEYVDGLRPDLLIVSDSDRRTFSEVNRLLDGALYARAFISGPYTVWVRDGVLTPTP